jgi:hypothetical protein
VILLAVDLLHDQDGGRTWDETKLSGRYGLERLASISLQAGSMLFCLREACYVFARYYDASFIRKYGSIK